MSKESVTVAGIDCGTNSIRLKIARVDADGMHEVVPRILRVIRLGQDVDKTHRFADEALERAYGRSGIRRCDCRTSHRRPAFRCHLCNS